MICRSLHFAIGNWIFFLPSGVTNAFFLFEDYNETPKTLRKEELCDNFSSSDSYSCPRYRQPKLLKGWWTLMSSELIFLELKKNSHEKWCNWRGWLFLTSITSLIHHFITGLEVYRLTILTQFHTIAISVGCAHFGYLILSNW